MADTTALKNRIRAAIKANDNQEITGPVLQQSLLDIVDELNGATETEANARQGADNTLQQSITAEKNRAEGAESTLQQHIDAEAEAREGADNTLQQSITAEKNRAEGAESTLQQLLDSKAEKTELSKETERAANSEKSLKTNLDDTYKKSNPNDSEGNVVDTNTIFSIKDNPEYIKVITDNVGKLIEAIGLDGIRKFFAGIEVQGTLQCVTDNPEYIAVWLDNQERIVFGFKINGDPYFGYGIPSQISSVIELLKSNIKTRIDTLQQSIDNNILALDYNSDTGELYSLTGETSVVNASMDDNGDVYLEQEII
jgi:hypothetical protein